MASRPSGPGAYAVGLCLRALAFAALVVGALFALLAWGFYAAGLLLAVAAALVFLDLRAAVLRADRTFRDLVHGLAARDYDRVGRSPSGFRGYSAAVEQVVDSLLEERAQRQRRLDRLLALLDAVPAALFMVDPVGRVQLSNAAARRLVGEEAVRLEHAPAIGRGAAERILGIAAGGREVLRLANGRQVLATSLRFAERGGPLERLVALQDVAVELDAVEVKAWQDLVRVLAHEILNSLTPISALADSLHRRADLDPESAASIEVIARRSLGLMDFVDRYRKVADMPTPNWGTMELRAFLPDLERLVRPMMVSAGITFDCTPCPAGLTIEADRQLVEQAVINLLKNARDAVAGQADARINLSCRRAEARVEIIVEDNGPGLSSEVLEHLFVPFFTTKPGGSGIGLSLARQIALAHHGQLEATAASPTGALFRLALPAERPVRPPPAAGRPPARATRPRQTAAP